MQRIAKQILVAIITFSLLFGASATRTLAKGDRPQLKKIFKHQPHKRENKILDKAKSKKS